MRIAAAVLMALAAAGASPAQNSAQNRLDEAATVFEEVMQTADKAIPQGLLDRAQCIVVVPGLKKGAFIVGAKYGKGVQPGADPAQHRGLPVVGMRQRG